MNYGREEVSRDLTLVGENKASFEVRAQLEQHLLTESPRDCRRLNLLRGLAYEKTTELFTRSTGTRGSIGVNQRTRPFMALGCHAISSRQNRLYARDAKEVESTMRD